MTKWHSSLPSFLRYWLESAHLFNSRYTGQNQKKGNIITCERDNKDLNQPNCYEEERWILKVIKKLDITVTLGSFQLINYRKWFRRYHLLTHSVWSRQEVGWDRSDPLLPKNVRQEIISQETERLQKKITSSEAQSLHI